MSSGSHPQVSRGAKVRHKDGTEGVAVSNGSGGTVQVKTTKGVIVAWSVYDLMIIEEGGE